MEGGREGGRDVDLRIESEGGMDGWMDNGQLMEGGREWGVGVGRSQEGEKSGEWMKKMQLRRKEGEMLLRIKEGCYYTREAPCADFLTQV